MLVGKRGSGFWEGGKGTRDKLRMNRKGLSIALLLFVLEAAVTDGVGRSAEV